MTSTPTIEYGKLGDVTAPSTAAPAVTYSSLGNVNQDEMFPSTTSVEYSRMR